MSTFRDILEQSIQDIYACGNVTEEEYKEAMEMINNQYQMNQVEQDVPDDIKKYWHKTVDLYHGGDISEDEYIDILEELMDDIEHYKKKNVNDSFERAMRGI